MSRSARNLRFFSMSSFRYASTALIKNPPRQARVRPSSPTDLRPIVRTDRHRLGCPGEPCLLKKKGMICGLTWLTMA
jgi:hypothetical protein